MDNNFLLLFSEGAAEADTGTAINTDTASQPTGEVRETGEKSDEEEFEELIKGKYSDAFKKRIQGIIDKRFSKMKSYENTVRVCTPLFEKLRADFPDVDKADTEGLINAFLERNSEDNAEKTENTVPQPFIDKVRETLKLRAAENVRDTLLRESDELRKIYPSFDLQRELTSSPEMKQLLLSGVPLRRAFEAVNLEQIMGSVLRFAVMKAGKDTADALRGNARVQENSLSDRASSVKRTDVKNLTEKEILKIIEDAGKGARITFKS